MNTTKYVALLRGIAPLNPNMRNEKLRGVFEGLGFTHVSTVISSGNVLFESASEDVPALEAMIEAALPSQLGFTSTTIIRSREQLQRLVDRRPFGSHSHNQQTYLTVTFLKNEPKKNQALPIIDGYKILDTSDRAILSIVDLAQAKTPNLMSRLEKVFGKQITTRTWKTVERILKRMEA